MDVALSGQWSGMPSFSLIIYSYIEIKVFIVNIWYSQWSPVSKSTILGRIVWVLVFS